MFKKIKISFYQKQMRVFSLKYFEEKKILSRLRRRQAKKMIKSERWKEKVANAIVKKLQILDDGERRKESIEGKNEWLKKIKFYQQNKIIAEQTARKTEEETKFWSFILKTKKEMENMKKQRMSHKWISLQFKNEEIRIAKDAVREFV